MTRAGLCYNCEFPFMKGHRCTMSQFLCLLVDEAEEGHDESQDREPFPASKEPDPPLEINNIEDLPCISFHELIGMMVPSTLKIEGKIHG